MEPLAPGTEDDVDVADFPSVSKKANEQERLLSLRAKLPSGKYGNVFELNYYNGGEHWYCNLCECPIMGRVYHHEIGKRHSNNISVSGKFGSSLEENEPAIQIAPGEPMPPGFESERVARIQETLNSFTVGPLIGLEYLLEIQEYDRDKEPSYLCMLCDKKGDPRTVIAHLASYNHITQYMQRHFVTCYRALSPYITKQFKRNWQNTMQKIAEAIEFKFGRLKPHVAERESLDKKRAHYQKIIESGPHFSERSGWTFEELVDKEELTKVITDEPFSLGPFGPKAPQKPNKRNPSPPRVPKPKRPKPAAAVSSTSKRKSLSSISSISSSDLSDYEPPKGSEKKYGHSPPRRDRSPVGYVPSARSRNAPRGRYGGRRRSFSRSPNRRPYDSERDRRVPPWQRSNYRQKSDYAAEAQKNKSNKMDEFKKLSEAIENDMDRVLKQHKKNPEKHPQYNDEWKKFWNKRYKELQAEGKDASKYDFKPDWIEFWNKRMTELHNAEVKLKKDALRRRLDLPEEPAPICFKITGKKKPSRDDSKAGYMAPMASIPDNDPDVIIIDDKDDDSLCSKRSHSPWEQDPSPRSNSRQSFGKARDRSWDRDKRSGDSRSRESRSRDRSRGRSRSWDRDYPPRNRSRERITPPYRDMRRRNNVPEYIKPSRVLRDVTRHPVHSPPFVTLPKVFPESDDDDADLNIVGVLRLLTALEEKLGSLGTKVIDLLAQALAMEKLEANSAEKLLWNEMNCVLFEMVKEKLKGQLLAGLVEYPKEKAFKTAIKKIASLMHFANEAKKEQERKARPKVASVTVPGVGNVDKAAIAKQIATALIMQGKTDVTQEELEQLINAVVGMAEKSAQTSKPVTTASFLEQLTDPKCSPASKPLDNIDTSPNSMEGLSDSDLQTLLQNFKDLSNDEQHGLISYLKKLEAKEPERVERLRKFVNLDTAAEKTEKIENARGVSPFSNRSGGVNPTESIDPPETKKEPTPEKIVEKPPVKLNLDSDEEEYSFEDVFKAAKKNVNESELEKQRKKEEDKRREESNMAVIANLMGQIDGKNAKTETAPKTPNLTPSLLESLNFSLPVLTDIMKVANSVPQKPATPTQAGAIDVVKKQEPTPDPMQVKSLLGLHPTQIKPIAPIQDPSSSANFRFPPKAIDMFEPEPVPEGSRSHPNRVEQGPQFRNPAPSSAYGQYNSNVPQNVQYPIRGPQPYQNISYPQQNAYRHPQGFGAPKYTPPFEFGGGNVRSGNPNQYKRPGEYGGYNNRW